MRSVWYIDLASMRPIDKIRFDKTAFRSFSSFKEMEEADMDHDLSQTPQQRWEEMEIIRQLNHADYDPTTSRIPRPVKIIQSAGLKTPAHLRARQ